LIKSTLGRIIDLAELYSPAPYAGKSVTEVPLETNLASDAYVPSSGPNLDGELGKTKKKMNNLSVIEAARIRRIDFI
jgi:hypothetical protein